MPDKSPEPTPVSAGSSASRSTVFGPAWLSWVVDITACRSASRFFRFALFPDSDLGFRVVLVTGP